MHDDQHGTAVVVLAALIGAARQTNRDISSLKVVISGAGSAGVAVTNLLLSAGVDDVIVLDSRGTIHRERDDLNPVKADLAARTNREDVMGGLAEALDGADVVVGLSSSTFAESAVAKMNKDAIIFALSNPTPEIMPDVAAKYAAVVATGRSDFPNQINNVLAFPGIFRGALDSGAKKITEGMKVAAAHAIANLVGDDLAPGYIIPSATDDRVMPAVAAAVAAEAEKNQ